MSTIINQCQNVVRECSSNKIYGRNMIKAKARHIPKHYQPHCVKFHIILVNDTSSYVTKYSGEGVYFAAKSEHIVAEELVELMKNGTSTSMIR